ncbi:MAG TPA: hypothetical protein VFX76_11410 [Roseiflexaceae bacterium]|nr:hypothetical protein [Roseiflexaceae bacterium]
MAADADHFSGWDSGRLRLLIIHVSVGTGHERAAPALAAACARKPGGEARVEDALAYGGRVFRRAYAQAYLELN